MQDIINWANENSGFVSVVIFILTLLIAWFSGLFSFLRNKPKFKMEVIEQCSFYSIFDLGRLHEGYPVHKSSFVLYLRITNIGRAPASIEKIKLGYLKSDFSHKFFSKRNYVVETIAKEEFKFKFSNSEKEKVYPFLKQRNVSFNNDSDSYLPVGKSNNGIAYFEEHEAYGSWMPRINKDNETSNIKLVVFDSFGNKYQLKFNLKLVSPQQAFDYSPYFGQTEKEYFMIENEKMSEE